MAVAHPMGDKEHVQELVYIGVVIIHCKSSVINGILEKQTVQLQRTMLLFSLIF